MVVTKEIEIDMGHRVPNHKSKCRNPHGHRYKIEVGVDDKIVTVAGASDEGMVIDFGDLKEAMMQGIDAPYDHSFMVYAEDELIDVFKEWKNKGLKVNIVGFIPTAENLAKYFYEVMKNMLAFNNIKIHHVRIWETPTSTTLYTERDERES